MMKKRLLALAMVGVMSVGMLTGCGGEKSSEETASQDGVITINYPTFQCGVNTAAPVVEELVKEFNEEYIQKNHPYPPLLNPKHLKDESSSLNYKNIPADFAWESNLPLPDGYKFLFLIFKQNCTGFYHWFTDKEADA